MEKWVASQFEDIVLPVLHCILIPNDERPACLQALNRMNIHHLSLFPDLNGASRFVNLSLEATYP